jgi:tripartite-type tricarboxylate transporter receptor subunit TctC
VLVPAKTPIDIVERLQGAIAQGLAPGSPGAAKLIAIGSEIATAEQMTPAGFAAFLEAEFESLRTAAKLAGLAAK